MKLLNLKNDLIDTINEIADTVRNGGVAILPFDTVYGFVCDPKNEVPLQKIYELKKRPVQKTIGLAVADIEALESVAEVDDIAKKYIEERTPGRYTFILKKLGLSSLPSLSSPMSSSGPAMPLESGTRGSKIVNISDFCIQNGTVGVRIPNSKLILEVTKACGDIIAQTSANISGQPNCFSLDEIKNQYDDESLSQVDLIVDGGILENDGASKLVDLTGSIPKEIERG